MAANPSLRYAASMQLHHLDNEMTYFSQQRANLLSTLTRLCTVQGQIEAIERRQQFIARRGASPSTTFETSLEATLLKHGEGRQEIERILLEMSAIVSRIHDLYNEMSSVAGQIHTDPFLHAYSIEVGSEVFNAEYRELQRAMEVMGNSARALSAETRVKEMQYKNCPPGEYERLVKAWSMTVASSDQEMDELAAMMIS